MTRLPRLAAALSAIWLALTLTAASVTTSHAIAPAHLTITAEASR